jgi:hypothetical protein
MERGYRREFRSAKETAMFEGLAAKRLLAVFALGWLMLNFPLLGLWDRGVSVFGIPLLPTALFVGWAALIALLAWIAERGED